MKPTADEVLSLLLSCLQLLSHPSSFLVQTLEAWDDEDFWRPKIRKLQRRGWIQPASTSAHLPYQVTPAGRQQALGPLNPESWWNRPWNGKWLAFCFDLPVHEPACRRFLLRWLHAERFGLLQNSVWIRPDLPTPPIPPMRNLPGNADGLVILEASCHHEFTDAQIVNVAWDFTSINNQYRSYLHLCQQQSNQPFIHDQNPQRAIAWIRQERSAWDNILRLDPLLPQCLWPPDYLGPDAWDARRRLLGI
jgi:DNA-binding transcriptional regulator PaaX